MNIFPIGRERIVRALKTEPTVWGKAEVVEHRVQLGWGIAGKSNVA